MSKVSGVVDFIGQKPNKSWNVKLNNGEWYGHGFKAPKFAKGDFITFDVAENVVGDRTFKNVDAGSVVVSPKDVKVPEQAPQVGYGDTKGANQWDIKDRKITYLASQKDAIEIIKVALASDAISLGTKKAAKLDILISTVQTIAQQLFIHAATAQYEVTTPGSTTKAEDEYNTTTDNNNDGED